MTSSEPLVIAHRGSSGRAPENTIPAIEQAITESADFVEVDLQLTKDGEVVLLHDPTLDRTTDASDVLGDNVRINDVTLDELRGLDAGSWLDEQYAKTRVPTLREALEVMDNRIGLWLELKSPHLHPGLEKAVAEVLRTAEGDWLDADNTVATCFDAESLDRFGAEVDEVSLGQLVKAVGDDPELVHTATRASYLIPDCRRMRPGDVTRIRATGMEAACWIPNDAVTMASMLAQGTVGLITNYPRLAGEIVRGEYILPDHLAIELLVEEPDGCAVTLRNLTGEPINLADWHLRDAEAELCWVGSRTTPEEVPARGSLRLWLGKVRLPDSIALHAPNTTLVDVAGRVPSPTTGGNA